MVRSSPSEPGRLEPAAFEPIVARATPAALAQVAAALTAGRPVLPLHPRLGEAERARLVARVAGHAIPEGTGVILATSGSTGEPKLCALGADALAASARASRANIPLGQGDRWLLAMSFAHAGGFSIVTRCRGAGADVVGLDGDTFSPDAALRAIHDEGVTHVSLVPTMLAKLLDADTRDALPKARVVLVGGAACSPSLYERARARGVRLLTTYGLTEAGSQVTTQRLDDRAARTPLDSGVPLDGTSVSIVDGRVVVRGPTLMHGYLGAPPIRGVFTTEDVGRIDAEGRLHVLGRADDTIITGGENVHPLEVERDLAALSGVGAALVAGVPDPTWGAIVGAVVTLGPGVRLEAVADEARASLPSFRVPRRWRVVDSLPIAPSGKVDRRAAARMLAETPGEVGADRS